MRILITGGAGLNGPNLAERLVNDGHRHDGADLSKNSAAHEQIFNMGTDKEVTITALAKKAIAATDPASNINYVACSSNHPGGFEDMNRRLPDVSKLQTAIESRPKTPPEQDHRRYRRRKTPVGKGGQAALKTRPLTLFASGAPG
jgi:nucleoside-diphosphate-sugar epimerase